MLITRETDYAIRLIRGLSDGQRQTVATLAQNEQVPRQFAYKILKKLQNAGFIEILRGAEGGCMLAVDLDQVTLLDLMRATGEDTAVIACMRPDYTCKWCQHHGETTCRVHRHLSGIQQEMERELSACSLKTIIFGNETSNSQ